MIEKEKAYRQMIVSKGLTAAGLARTADSRKVAQEDYCHCLKNSDFQYSDCKCAGGNFVSGISGLGAWEEERA